MARGKLSSALKRYHQSEAYKKNLDKAQNHTKNIRTAQKAAQAARTRSAQLKHPKASWHPFTDEQNSILLVGEGDFSFALAFTNRFSHATVLATSLDSVEEVASKYPLANETLSKLADNGVEIMHQIDATKLSKYKPIKALPSPLTVVFNFPHLGNSISDQDRNIRQHQELVMQFFNQCSEIGAKEVVMTLFCGEPYDSWQFKQFAKQAGYTINRSTVFNWAEWPPYAHQLTSKVGETSKAQTKREARMYHWIKH